MTAQSIKSPWYDRQYTERRRRITEDIASHVRDHLGAGGCSAHIQVWIMRQYYDGRILHEEVGGLFERFGLGDPS